jgi:hypothetical protein
MTHASPSKRSRKRRSRLRKRTMSVPHWGRLAGLADDGRSLAAAQSQRSANAAAR